MSEIINNDIPTLAAPYLERKKKFSDLNLTDPTDKKVALYCLRHKKAFLTDLKIDDPLHLELLKSWVAEDYSNYITLLNSNLDHEDLLNIYLYLKYKAGLKQTPSVSVMRSLKKQTLLKYRYKTQKGETISYFDKSLGVPTVLTLTADLRFKIISPQKFIESMDIDIAVLDLQLSVSHINDLFGKTIRDVILNTISEKGLSYYQLPQYYSSIVSNMIKESVATFGKIGLELGELNIRDITIPNNTNELFENQFFAIAEAERVKEYEFRMEKQSLDLYEKKAEIHSKYPEFPVTLTESEKDFALNRYLRRIGQDTGMSTNIVSDELDIRREDGNGTVTKTKLVMPIAPTEPKKPSLFRKIYIILFILFIIASSLMFILSIPAGLISLGVTIFIFGIIAAAKLNTLKSGYVDAKAYAEYKRQYEDYKREYDNYLAEKNENKMV